MSIIYDALKKIEKNNILTTESKINKPPSKSKRKIYLLYILAILAGFLLANMLFNSFAKPQAGNRPLVVKKHPSGEQKQKKQSPSPPLTLNGVFFSEGDSYALINNQIVKINDMVNGFKVTWIGLDEVELKKEDSIVKLYTPKELP